MIIYNFFKSLYLHIKYTRLLNSIYKREKLLDNLSKLFEESFKQDWVGRIYTVINPYIIGQRYDGSKVVFEINENGADDKEYIEQYIMEKLIIVQKFLYTNNLFDLLMYDIKKIDDYGNYLFVMRPITYDDFVKYTKRFFILLGVLCILGILGIIIYKLNIF